MYDQMKDMAKTPVEMETQSTPSVAEQNIYPYNLCITLENDELEKLGIDLEDQDCQVGNYLHLHALAEVTGVSKRDTGEGVKHCLNLQITHLSAHSEDQENEDEETNDSMISYG